jgi:hypothetical protein
MKPGSDALWMTLRSHGISTNWRSHKWRNPERSVFVFTAKPFFICDFVSGQNERGRVHEFAMNLQIILDVFSKEGNIRHPSEST